MKFVLCIVVGLLTVVTALAQTTQIAPPADQVAVVQDFLNQAWEFCGQHPKPTDSQINDFLTTVMAPKPAHVSHDPKDWPRKLIHRLAIRRDKGYYLKLPDGSKTADGQEIFGGNFSVDDQANHDSVSNRAVNWELVFPSGAHDRRPPDDDQGLTARLVGERWRFILVQTKDGWRLEEASYSPRSIITTG